MDPELDRKIAKNWREYLQEARDTKEMIAWIWREMMNADCKTLAKRMFILLIIACVIDVATPWILSLVFNGLNPRSKQINMVIAGLVGYGLVILLSELINYKRMVSRELMFGERSRQLDYRVTQLFFEKSLGVHINDGNMLHEANLQKSYQRILQIQDMMLFQGLQILLGLLFAFCALWFLSWVVALMVCAMLILQISWSIFLNQQTMEKCIPIEKKWRIMHRFMVERWNQVERVKTNNKENDELAELSKQFNDNIVPDRNFWVWFIGQTVKRGTITYLILIAAMIYGVNEVWDGRMTIGLLYPLFTWTRQLAENLWQVGHIEQQINAAIPSILAMKETLELPIGLAVSDKPRKLPDDCSCRIEFQDVNLSYSYHYKSKSEGENLEKSISVLKNVSFVIEPGEKVALIGSSGAGKTTIMRLLMRYMDPTSGSIKIDGVDLKDIELESWLRLVGYVPQQVQILNGTIRYNLLYGLPESEKNKISDHDLWRMVRLLKIDFGERLTRGLDTLVGRNGVKLSGGQAQRVMIGAAVMKNPRFMVIDEATSSLDPTTEKLVQEGLEKVLTNNRGALIITHRLNTVRRICNKFVMLNGDDCGNEGNTVTAIAASFEELALFSPSFRSLAKDQGIIL